MPAQKIAIAALRSGRNVVSALAAVVLLACAGAACTSSGSLPSRTHTTYPLPAPGAGPDSAQLPKAAPDPGGIALKAATTLAAQVAAGGTGGLAALRTALVKSGVTLIDTDGSVVSKGDAPLSGVEIPVGEMIAAAGQNTYTHGLTADHMASTVAALTRDKVNVTALRQQLLAGLALQGTLGQHNPAIPKTANFLAEFIIQLGLKAAPPVDLRYARHDDMQFTGLQTWLLWLSLASGEFDSAVAARGHGQSSSPGTQSVSSARTASFASGQVSDGRPIELMSSGPCTADGTGGIILDSTANFFNAFSGGVPFSPWEGFNDLLGKALGGGSDSDTGAGGAAATAGVLLALAHLAAEGFGLNAEMTMQGGEPLVRTQETHSDGDEKAIKLKLSYDIGATQWANCLRQVLNLAGTDLTLPNNGPVKGATVTWMMSTSGNYGLDDFVQFDEHGQASTSTASSKTDDNGETTMDLQGRRQRHTLPKDTKPFERYVTIMVGIATRDSNLANDLNDAVSTFLSATGGPLPVVASIVTTMFDRSGSLDVTRVFRVKDWPPDFKVNGHMDLDTGAYNGVVSGIKCGGVEGEWTISGGGTSLTFDMSAAGIADIPHGTVVLVQGNPAQLKFNQYGGYFKNMITVTPGDFPECHGQ
jgi:hypothetical protein